jgi:hypothetical protein
MTILVDGGSRPSWTRAIALKRSPGSAGTGLTPDDRLRRMEGFDFFAASSPQKFTSQSFGNAQLAPGNRLARGFDARC